MSKRHRKGLGKGGGEVEGLTFMDYCNYLPWKVFYLNLIFLISIDCLDHEFAFLSLFLFVCLFVFVFLFVCLLVCFCKQGPVEFFCHVQRKLYMYMYLYVHELVSELFL